MKNITTGPSDFVLRFAATCFRCSSFLTCSHKRAENSSLVLHPFMLKRWSKGPGSLCLILIMPNCSYSVYWSTYIMCPFCLQELKCALSASKNMILIASPWLSCGQLHVFQVQEMIKRTFKFVSMSRSVEERGTATPCVEAQKKTFFVWL